MGLFKYKLNKRGVSDNIENLKSTTRSRNMLSLVWGQEINTKSVCLTKV